MHCPFCAHDDTKVIDSRLAGEGQQIRRRRECLDCGERFTTFETAELVMPLVVKNDESREPFDESKLRGGMLKALEKRPVSSEAIEEAVGHISAQAARLGEREVDVAADRRDRDGRAAPPRRGRLRALRLGVPQLPGRRRVPRRDRAPAQSPQPRGRAKASCRCCRATPAKKRQGAQMKCSVAFDEADDAPRARARGARPVQQRIRIRASAACSRATRRSSAKAGTNVPASRMRKRDRARAAGERARGATAYVTLEPCIAITAARRRAPTR